MLIMYHQTTFDLDYVPTKKDLDHTNHVHVLFITEWSSMLKCVQLTSTYIH